MTERYDPNFGLNRAQRRKLAKVEVKAHKKNPESKVFVQAVSIGEILDNEDDLPMLEREITVQNQLLDQKTTSLRLYRFYRKMGASELTSIVAAATTNPASALANISREFDRAKFLRSVSELDSIINLDKNKRKKAYYIDREERDFEIELRKARVPGELFLTESIRARHETIGLMEMQIEWLRRDQSVEHEATPQVSEQTVTPEEVQQTDIVVQQPPEVIAPAFGLAEWNLFFSEKVWSSLPSQLKPVDTSSFDAAVADVDPLTRTYRTIKPQSLVRAIGYHVVDRDVIQRALATRFRYAGEEERDWVKVKRGKDRIGLLIDEEARRIVFCIEGRDIVYRR